MSAFVSMVVIVLSTTPHASHVESISKDHQMIHNNARAGFGEKNTHRALYVFSNKMLKHKLVIPTSFTVFSPDMSESETNDIIASLSTLDTVEYLPRVCARRRRQAGLQ